MSGALLAFAFDDGSPLVPIGDSTSAGPLIDAGSLLRTTRSARVLSPAASSLMPFKMSAPTDW